MRDGRFCVVRSDALITGNLRQVDGISSIDEITGILKYCSTKAKQKALLDKVLNAIFARSQNRYLHRSSEKCAHLFDRID